MSPKEKSSIEEVLDDEENLTNAELAEKYGLIDPDQLDLDFEEAES